jgi:hypothetical protein
MKDCRIDFKFSEEERLRIEEIAEYKEISMTDVIMDIIVKITREEQ